MRILRTITIPGFALFLLLAAFPARAVSNRIFMSTNGNNASDCANPLTPCLTFAGALAQVNPGGEVIAEATGGYGALNITHAVTINGPPGVVIYSGLQVNVNAPGATVVLRGLTIDGTGAAANGITVIAVGALHVESCVITGFTGADESAGNGIAFAASLGNLFVKDTIIRSNGYVGLWIIPISLTATATIDHCRIEGNQYGAVTESGASATIRDSDLSGNSARGIEVDVSSEFNIENCLVTNNAIGIESNGLARVSNTTVTDNGTGLATGGGTLLSRGNNTVQGNAVKGAFTGSFTPD